MDCHSTHLVEAARNPKRVDLGIAQADFFSVPKLPEETRWLHNSLLKKPQPELCFGCHGNIQAQFALPTHHRVPEGLMKCTDCHNTHGTSNRATLRQSGWETCTQCHTEKRGPFVFEHSAVKVEGCTACHTPHGSVNRMLLVAPRGAPAVPAVPRQSICGQRSPRPLEFPDARRLHALSRQHPRLELRCQLPALRSRHENKTPFRSVFLSAVLALGRFRCVRRTTRAKPLVLGGFENQGSFTTGYRFTDVSGYRPKFDELFDLNSGFRVLDFSLFGKAQEGQNRFADDYSLTLSGLGGDPYSTAQLTVRKNRLYDLRVNFRTKPLLLESKRQCRAAQRPGWPDQQSQLGDGA